MVDLKDAIEVYGWAKLARQSADLALAPGDATRRLNRVWNYLSKTQQVIAVTGMPGVGKTMLVDALLGKTDAAGYKPPRKSVEIEKASAPSDGRSIALRVVPGQSSRPRTVALDRLFNEKSRVAGVIHVVANGYSSDRKALPSVNDSIGINEYRLAAQQAELDDFRAIAGYIRAAHRKRLGPQWMLVVVNKVDLFPNTLTEAEMLYSPRGTGPFVSTVEELRANVGRDNLDWDCVPFSAWTENFVLGSNSVTSAATREMTLEFRRSLVHAIAARCGAKQV